MVSAVESSVLNATSTTAVPDIAASTVNALPLTAILLAMVASCNSVGAAVYTESLFKGGSSKGENFLHQQFWLYLYGGLVASVVHFVSHSDYHIFNLYADLTDMSGKLQLLLLVALLFGSLGGLVVAAILKLLDNIVKVNISENVESRLNPLKSVIDGIVIF